MNLSNWYVLQVKTSREMDIVKAISRLTNNNLRAIVFTREILHMKKGNKKLLTTPLFPGYVFVQNNIHEAVSVIKKYLPTEIVKAVCFDSRPIPVRQNEMEWLFSQSDDKGIIKLSKAYYSGDSVQIVNGPMKNLNGKIVFVNRKKHKAKVRFNLFSSSVDVSLGLEIIKPA